MAKIEFKKPTDVCAQMFAAAKDDRNCCSVIAIAALAGISYDEAAEVLQRCGREKGKSTSYAVMQQAMQELGLGYRSLEYPERRALIDTYPGAHKGLKSITPHHAVRFKKAWEEAGIKNGLIFTQGHVMALRDGVVHDHQHQSMKRVVGLWLVDLPEAEKSEAPASEEPMPTVKPDWELQHPAIDDPAEEAPAEEAPAEPNSAPADEGFPAQEAAPSQEDVVAYAAQQEAIDAEEARLDSLNRDGLRAECKQFGVKGYGTMNRAEMINAILRVRFPF